MAPQTKPRENRRSGTGKDVSVKYRYASGGEIVTLCSGMIFLRRRIFAMRAQKRIGH
ncbi:hypothetical protein CSE45_0518 [Citreicella sp. SE45]|nr:hypothetical protein CSE45_0518 [Citreicella sp. SE45]